MDVCPDCAAGTVDLSRAAFARIADPRTGMVAVSYQPAVDPPLPGPLVLRISAAARPGTLAVQVINHGNRLSSVAASRAGRAGGSGSRRAPTATGSGRCARRRSRAGRAGGPRPQGARIRVRVTDVAGHQVVLTGVPAARTVLHATRWMYRDRGLAGSRPRRPPRRLAARAGRHAGRPGPRAAADQARDQRPGRPGIAWPEPRGPPRTAPS